MNIPLHLNEQAKIALGSAGLSASASWPVGLSGFATAHYVCSMGLGATKGQRYVPGTAGLCTAFLRSFSHPTPDLNAKYTTRTAAMRWIQNCQLRTKPFVEQKNIRPSAPSNSISRVCSRPAGTRISKSRLFGGLRGRKGREMLELAMSRGNKKRPVGRGVRIRV